MSIAIDATNGEREREKSDENHKICICCTELAMHNPYNVASTRDYNYIHHTIIENKKHKTKKNEEKQSLNINWNS